MLEGNAQMDEPRVTVGMPVYNDPDGLRRTVPTIFGQTWRGELRLLVVDDGSTDETPEVLASLAAMYGRIDVVRNPENMGRPYARNRILEFARDGYLAWIDAGDLWDPRKLELQLGALRAAEARYPGTPLLCTGPLRWAFTDRGHNKVRVPDVTGDQLRNAILGTLFPYLQGLVGRVDHFRSLGGFDERLLRRQDYDLLVRFVGEGGRVVSSPSDIPVFTYLKSDVGTSPELVAAANKVICDKHRPYYRAYGWRLERQVRSRQQRLVARFYENNGRRARGRIHRIAARLWYPDLLAAFRGPRLMSRSARRLKRSLQATVTLVLRLVLLALGRRRAVKLAQLIGITHLVASTSSGRSLYQNVKTDLRGRNRSGRVGRRTSAEPAWITQLEAEVNAKAPADGAEPWLRLEQIYREQGLLYSAEATLRQGLEMHPGEDRLLVRLVELLPLRRKWQECVELWPELQSSAAVPTALAYARVARSLREVGRLAEAMAVATEGLQRWPAEVLVREELNLSRAALVDWEKAIVPARPGSAESAVPTGMVTDLGFLAGRDGPIAGWIAASPGSDGPVSLSLVVNGRPVATTSAKRPSADGRREFSFSCQDLLSYLGDGDTVAVTCAGVPLKMREFNAPATVVTGYESRFVELVGRLDSGFVFNKFGLLRKRMDSHQKAQILALYRDVAGVLDDLCGYPVFPFYGNLLGAIREHDIIAHDAGGFDMGYVSKHHDPEQVRAEFVGICRALLERGYHLRLEPWSVYVRSQRSDQVFVDVNYAWFTAAGELNFSFGWRYSPVTDRDRFFYPRNSLIGNHVVRVPGNSEQVLEQIYGPSWPVPDQGFALDAGLQRDPAFLLTVDEMLELERSDPDRVEARLDHYSTIAAEVRAE